MEKNSGRVLPAQPKRTVNNLLGKAGPNGGQRKYSPHSHNVIQSWTLRNPKLTWRILSTPFSARHVRCLRKAAAAAGTSHPKPRRKRSSRISPVSSAKDAHGSPLDSSGASSSLAQRIPRASQRSRTVVTEHATALLVIKCAAT